MRDARIERLLGGYATGTLSAAERESLFDAALDDQELFNALQDEEALRDLLADSESRQAISRALQQPAARRAKPWFAQGWVWAGATAATCAVLLMLNVSRTQYQPPREVAELKSTGAVAIPATPVTAPEAASRPLKRGVAPSPPGQARQQSQNLSPPIEQTQQEKLRAADQVAQIQAPASATPAPQMARSAAFRAAESTMDKSLHIETIPYSLWKRSADGQFAPLAPNQLLQHGDFVWLMVRPLASGSLSVSEPGSGNPKLTLDVTANQTYTVPDAAIQVTGARVLRLELTTGTPPRTLVTNITIAPGKTSNGR